MRRVRGKSLPSSKTLDQTQTNASPRPSSTCDRSCFRNHACLLHGCGGNTESGSHSSNGLRADHKRNPLHTTLERNTERSRHQSELTAQSKRKREPKRAHSGNQTEHNPYVLYLSFPRYHFLFASTERTYVSLCTSLTFAYVSYVRIALPTTIPRLPRAPRARLRFRATCCKRNVPML
jgi:hypothetical protein